MKKYLLLPLLCLLTLTARTQTVRVLLAEQLKEAQLKTSGLVYVYAQGESKKYKVSKAQILSVRLSGNSVSIGALKHKGPVIVEPAKDTELTFEKNVYTGKLYFIPQHGTLSVVEHTDIESYLLGVVPYEMSASWPVEALKAQAVAARTYTVMQLHPQKGYFDLYNDVRSQMYKGIGKRYDSVKEAVEKTHGQVLRYNGNLFNTYYHANCGGGTDDAKIWTGSTNATIAPLQGASCSYDSHSQNYEWKAIIPAKSVNSFAAKQGVKGNVKKIKVATRTKTKRAVMLEISSSSGSKKVSCAKFRLAVGAALLKSCKITDISHSAQGFSFTGKGFGHGIGMCQDGARGMAQAGKTYKQILLQYYPAAKLSDK